jgi:TaqI-like C-terminal specificity domain
VFEGVTTYPAIIALRKTPQLGELAYLVVQGEPPKDLARTFKEKARTMPRARLGEKSWRFEDDALAKLRDKIANGRKTLREVYGEPLYGIKTGLNAAFVIDTPTRERLVSADPNSSELLKPLLRGEDAKRWCIEYEGLWLINTAKGKVDIEAYPAIRDWLLPFKPELEKRATKQEWFELQQAQLAYQPKFSSAKVIWPQFMERPAFSLDVSGIFPINKCYLFAGAYVELVAILNSSCLSFCFRAISVPKRGGFREATAQHISPLPVPDMQTDARLRLAALGQSCTDAARERFDVQSSVRRRVLDLASERAKLTGKLNDWHELDFAAFRKEVKRAFHTDIPLRERGEWEGYLRENAVRVRELSDRIASAEREIDRIVYDLFDLTPDEISLLETSFEGQY